MKSLEQAQVHGSYALLAAIWRIQAFCCSPNVIWTYLNIFWEGIIWYYSFFFALSCLLPTEQRFKLSHHAAGVYLLGISATKSAQGCGKMRQVIAGYSKSLRFAWPANIRNSSAIRQGFQGETPQNGERNHTSKSEIILTLSTDLGGRQNVGSDIWYMQICNTMEPVHTRTQDKGKPAVTILGSTATATVGAWGKVV